MIRLAQTFRFAIALFVVGCAASCSLLSASAQQQEAIDQATAASKITGAPMLVIAGRETCPNCQNLIKTLGQREFARLTSGMIPLKIDVDQPQWREWSGKQGRPNGTTLPFVYVVRADGQTMHSHSGPMEANELANVIGVQLQRAGQPLNERQVSAINDAVEAARTSFEEGKTAQAVRELLPLKRIGELGQIGSYAECAVEADKLVAEMAEQVSQTLETVSQQIDSQENSTEACFQAIQAKRIFGSIDAIDAMINPVLAEIRRERSLRDAMSDAQSVDRACKQCENSSSRQRGLDALQTLIDEAPDSPLAELASKQLEKYQVDQ